MRENAEMPTSSRAARADAACASAVDLARAALAEVVDGGDVGDYLGHRVEGERLVTHTFACRRPGYLHWHWSVTVARASRRREVTVDELVLLPGPDAVTAPPWVPWSERVQAGDVTPGHLLPASAEDPRLVPGYADLGADAGSDTGVDTGPDAGPDAAAVALVAQELGLGRPRVLSAEGRELAAERWYAGRHGPEAPIAVSAPAHCSSCGFAVQMRGALGVAFAVCANEFSPSDGEVVSFDHGCGAHSGVPTAAAADGGSAPLPPEPALDTIGYDELVAF
jgi:hypothetical protein